MSNKLEVSHLTPTSNPRLQKILIAASVAGLSITVPIVQHFRQSALASIEKPVKIDRPLSIVEIENPASRELDLITIYDEFFKKDTDSNTRIEDSEIFFTDHQGQIVVDSTTLSFWNPQGHYTGTCHLTPESHTTYRCNF
jgi:hypothetical protein